VKRIFVSLICALIGIVACKNSYSDPVPLELTVKPDKEIYAEGDIVTLKYSVTNMTEKDVGYYTDSQDDRGKGFDFHITNAEKGKTGIKYQFSYYYAGTIYDKLPPKGKEDGKKELGRIVFGEFKGCKDRATPPAPKRGPRKSFCVANAIFYDGFKLDRENYVLEDDVLEGEARFCTTAKRYLDYMGWQRERGEEVSEDPDAFTGCADPVPLKISLDLSVPKEGLVKSYHEDGSLRLERNYKDGKLNGPAKYYYSKKSYGTRNYKDGKLEGEAIDFYDNDQPRNVWNFADGKLNGETRSYSKNGQMHSLAHYKNGRLDGPAEFYDQGGKLIYTANYKDGKLQDEAFK